MSLGWMSCCLPAGLVVGVRVVRPHPGVAVRLELGEDAQRVAVLAAPDRATHRARPAARCRAGSARGAPPRGRRRTRGRTRRARPSGSAGRRSRGPGTRAGRADSRTAPSRPGRSRRRTRTASWNNVSRGGAYCSLACCGSTALQVSSVLASTTLTNSRCCCSAAVGGRCACGGDLARRRRLLHVRHLTGEQVEEDRPDDADRAARRTPGAGRSPPARGGVVDVLAAPAALPFHAVEPSPGRTPAAR